LRALLDTQAILWAFLGHPALSANAATAIANPESALLVSAASAWEIAIKVRSGKLPQATELMDDFLAYLKRFSFDQLPISLQHGIQSALLPGHHKDPFDRMLAAQCHAEGLSIISNDKIFDLYGVNRIW
jgi:PIN domain nuclease of toxin-antitoxin system